MSCATADGIGALTTPCQGGCGPKGPTRRYYLADRIDAATRMTAGQVVRAKFDGAPLRDTKGRIAHVTGFSLIGTLRLTTTTTTNEAVPGYQTLAKFSNFFLEDVSGWQYFSGNVDGRNLIDDVFMRNLRLTDRGVGSDGLEADVGTAQANDITIRLHHEFTPQDAFNPSLRGAIPLKALTDKTDALRFTVGALPESYTGVTDSGFQGTFELWLHLVYLDSMLAEPGWQLEYYQQTDTSGRLRHADRMHEYIAVRPMPEDDGSRDLSGYAGITVQNGDDVVVKSYSASDMNNMRENVFSTDIYSRPSDLPQLLTETIQYFMLVPRSRTKRGMPSGVVTYQYTSRSDSTTDYLHRTVACQNGNRAKELTRSVFGCQGDVDKVVDAVPVNDRGQPTTTAVDPGATLVVVPKGINYGTRMI